MQVKQLDEKSLDLTENIYAIDYVFPCLAFSQNSLPTKEATMRLGGGMFVVNCHFLSRDDSFPIE